MIGQHAKANTDGGHLCHSGSFTRDDWRINGQSYGEIANFFLLAGSMNIPVVMLSGDLAACTEARQLVPSIKTVAVIEGEKLGSTEGMNVQQALDHNIAAVHVCPQKAREMIRQAASRCLNKVDSVERFWIDPPYEMQRINRPDEQGRRTHAINRASTFLELRHQRPVYEPYEQ